MSEYSDYQSARDREYLAAWKNLSPRERRRLEKAGITGPAAPSYHTHKHDDDALLACASEPVATEPATSEMSPDVMDVLRRILGELMAQDNIRLTLECLALVTGLSYSGNSMTDIAKRHGVTRAAVSKRCVDTTDALGLPPSRAMRRLTARSSYERRQRRVLDRNDRFPDSIG
jgi:hypothetical protein